MLTPTAPFTGRKTIADHWSVCAALWLMFAFSSFVVIEPAPYDVIAMLLFVVVFALGLPIPRAIALPILAWVVFLLGNTFASMASDDPVATVKSLATRFYMIATWLMLTALIANGGQRVIASIWSGWMLAGVVAVVLGVGTYLGFIPYTELFTAFGRAKGAFKDPNVYGPFLVPIALYCLARLEDTRGLKQLMFSFFFAFFTIGTVLGFSRGAWLDFAVAITLFLGIRLLTSRSNRQYLRIFFVIIFLVISVFGLLAAALSNEQVGKMMETRAQLQSYDTDQRFVKQRMAIEEIFVHPVGIGAGMGEAKFGLVPHNVYLQIFSESGWIGGLGFLALIVLTIFASLKVIRDPDRRSTTVIVAFACTIGVLVQSLFIDSTHWRHLYVLLAFLWGAILSKNPANNSAIIH